MQSVVIAGTPPESQKPNSGSLCNRAYNELREVCNQVCNEVLYSVTDTDFYFSELVTATDTVTDTD